MIGKLVLVNFTFMVRTSITPDQTDIHLSVPQNYVGRKLEVLLYPVDELDEQVEKPLKKKPSDFIGTMSNEEADMLRKHVEQSRNEWERNF